MNKVGNGNCTQAMRWSNTHPRCTHEQTCKMFPNSTVKCHISGVQKCALVVDEQKEAFSQYNMCHKSFVQKCALVLVADEQKEAFSQYDIVKFL